MTGLPPPLLRVMQDMQAESADVVRLFSKAIAKARPRPAPESILLAATIVVGELVRRAPGGHEASLAAFAEAVRRYLARPLPGAAGPSDVGVPRPGADLSPGGQKSALSGHKKGPPAGA